MSNSCISISNSSGNTISGSYGSCAIIYTTTDSLTDYMDFTLKLLGIDLTYEKFKNMSESDKQSLLRDIKINRIIT
jgi:hypothetical protein